MFTHGSINYGFEIGVFVSRNTNTSVKIAVIKMHFFCMVLVCVYCKLAYFCPSNGKADQYNRCVHQLYCKNKQLPNFSD